jgi:hypothetical protein
LRKHSYSYYDWFLAADECYDIMNVDLPIPTGMSSSCLDAFDCQLLIALGCGESGKVVADCATDAGFADATAFATECDGVASKSVADDSDANTESPLFSFDTYKEVRVRKGY